VALYKNFIICQIIRSSRSDGISIPPASEVIQSRTISSGEFSQIAAFLILIIAGFKLNYIGTATGFRGWLFLAKKQNAIDDKKRLGLTRLYQPAGRIISHSALLMKL